MSSSNNNDQCICMCVCVRVYVCIYCKQVHTLTLYQKTLYTCTEIKRSRKYYTLHYYVKENQSHTHALCSKRALVVRVSCIMFSVWS